MRENDIKFNCIAIDFAGDLEMDSDDSEDD